MTSTPGLQNLDTRNLISDADSTKIDDATLKQQKEFKEIYDGLLATQNEHEPNDQVGRWIHQLKTAMEELNETIKTYKKAESGFRPTQPIAGQKNLTGLSAVDWQKIDHKIRKILDDSASNMTDGQKEQLEDAKNALTHASTALFEYYVPDNLSDMQAHIKRRNNQTQNPDNTSAQKQGFRARDECDACTSDRSGNAQASSARHNRDCPMYM